MKTPMSSDEIIAWGLPEETFRSFRQDPNNNRFRENVLPLDGVVRVRGNGKTIHLMEVDLKSRDVPIIRFKGSLTRHWHLFQVNFVLI